MPSNFPNSADAFTTKTPHVSVNAAADVNNLQDAVLAIETALLTAPNPNTLDYMSKSRPDTVTAVKVFSAAPIFNAGATFPSSAGVVAMGTGDDVPYFVNGTAWEMTSQQGTAASPITTGAGPNVKISRTESIPASTMPSGNGSNNQGNAGLWTSALGDVNNETQVSAGLFTAKNNSNKVRTPPTVNIDACGVQGFGEIGAGGTGNGIGAYLEGRVDSSAGAGATGAEVRINNNSGADVTFNATGYTSTTGLWLTPGSSTAGRVNGPAFATGVTNSCQWDVGLGFTTLGGISSIKTSTFDDESNSINSILIAGTHTRAIGIKAGAGPILIGHTNATDAATNANALIEAFTTSTTARALIAAQGSGVTAELSYKIGNSAGSSEYFVVGTAGHLLTGSAQGDTGIIINTANKRFLVGGTTQVIQVTNGNALGFFAHAEATQQTVTGSRSANAALASLLTALAAHGLVVDSSTA